MQCTLPPEPLGTTAVLLGLGGLPSGVGLTYTYILRMKASTLAIVLASVAVSGCVSAPAPHPRALESNELCAQQVQAGQLDRAEVYCDLGLEFSPFYADLWVNKGLIYLRRQRNDKAKECFIKAIRYNQETAQAYNNLGYIYLQEKSYGKAHDNFQRALKVNPDYTEARYNLGLAFVRMKKFKQARKEFDTIVAINPNLADPHHYLGYMSLTEGKCEDAIPELETATRLDPAYTDAWFNLGNAFNACGKFSEAKDAFTSCVGSDDNNIECKNNLALINRKLALLDPALKDMKAVRAAEGTPQSLYELAKTYGDKGLRAEQKRTYKKCLELDNKYPLCHYGLFELYQDDQQLADAGTACKNFLKFVVAEEYPLEVGRCEKFLNLKTN